MPIDRRQFFRHTGLVAAGAAAAGSHRVSTVHTAAPTPPPWPDDWQEVRAQFALSPEFLHFSTFFLVSHPRPVREAIERYRRQLDANPLLTVEHGTFGSEAESLGLRVKRAAAEYLGAKPEEIALTQSTTMGLAIVYQGLVLAPQQEILTTEHDHYSHHESIRLAALRSGATVRKIALFDRLQDLPALTAAAIVERIRAAIRPATRVLGITWVHSQSGLKLPLAAIAAAVREVNDKRDEGDRVLLVVDGVHGFGVEDVSAATTGVDVFVAGTHKWIFGPRGTGLVWARAPVWAAMRPTVPTFDSDDSFMGWMHGNKPGPLQAAWFSPGGFHAFEHDWAVADAFAFHQQIGRKRIADRIHELNGRLKEGLATLDHVTLYTPRDRELSAGLVGFDVAGMKAEDVVKRLEAKKILATASPYARRIARLAAGIMNTPEEVDAAVAAVAVLKS